MKLKLRVVTRPLASSMIDSPGTLCFVVRAPGAFSFIHVRFCRSTWEDEASKFGTSYDVDKKAAAICDVILRRAKAQFLTAARNGQFASGQSHGRVTK